MSPPSSGPRQPLTGQVTVDLPPPQAQGTRSLFGQQASVLHFPGLSYVICQGSALPLTRNCGLSSPQLAREWEIPGAGVLFWNPQEDFMRSAVYLPKPTPFSSPRAAPLLRPLWPPGTHAGRRDCISEPSGSRGHPSNHRGHSRRQSPSSVRRRARDPGPSV